MAKARKQKHVDILSIYEDLLGGRRQAFPPGTWSVEKEGMSNLVRCLRYLIDEKLGWDRREIVDNISRKFFVTYRLDGAINIMLDRSPYRAISLAFPEYNIRPWELKMSPNGTWNPDTAREAVKWLIEIQLQWDRDTVISSLTRKHFEETNLSGLLTTYFGDSIYRVLVYTYPDQDWSSLKPLNAKDIDHDYITMRLSFSGNAVDLTESEVVRIRKVLLENPEQLTVREIARRFRTTPSAIFKIKSGATWKNII